MKNEIEPKICPLCGFMYSDAPSLSRKDNKTLICPDCGMREALASIKLPYIEQENIIKNIHSFKAKNNY